jgi:hypothetical protein
VKDNKIDVLVALRKRMQVDNLSDAENGNCKRNRKESVQHDLTTILHVFINFVYLITTYNLAAVLTNFYAECLLGKRI